MTKTFELSKNVVWKAYKLVKANKGTGGVDGVSIKDFEVDLKSNLYKIWNRLSSGSYFPPPVKAVEIPKKNGGVRILGIPTIGDRIAQMAIRLHFEPKVEPYFHKDSYGYRPNRSAHDAIAITRKRCWKNDYVFEFDIKGLFDNIDHDLLMKAVKKHTNSRMEILYIKRWLKAPIINSKGIITPREKGVPQGGVISPVLSNLFLHYTLDKWLEVTHPHFKFCRYADDGLIHCCTMKQARYVERIIKDRLQECGLEIHPEKSKIIFCSSNGKVGKNCEHRSFDFLGYTFRRRSAIDRDGQLFCSFLPGISNKAKNSIRSEIKKIKSRLHPDKNLNEIAEILNPKIRGWFNYYGKFTKSAMSGIEYHIDSTIRKWLQKKYKKMKGHPRKSIHFLNKLRRSSPKIFAHWNV